MMGVKTVCERKQMREIPVAYCIRAAQYLTVVAAGVVMLCLRGLVVSSQGLDRYWMEPLMSLTKPEARKVAMQLSSANKLGYVSTRGGPVGKGSLLEFVLAQKEKHPTKVISVSRGQTEY